MPPPQSGLLNPVPGGERGNPHQAAQPAPRSAAPEPAPGARVLPVVEPPAAPEPAQTTQRVREVSIVLPREPNSGPRVELNIAERGGEVRVAVRTPDPHVRQTLRAELPALVERLEQGGYRAEATAAGVERPAAQHTQMTRAGEAADASGRDPMAWGFDDGRQERQERQAHGAYDPRQPRGSGRTKSEDRSFYEFFR